MARSKYRKEIEFEWVMVIEFIFLWGIIYLGLIVLDIGWFLALEADLSVMWLSNIPISLLITIYQFAKGLTSEEEYDPGQYGDPFL
jgi:hypothetical protein